MKAFNKWADEYIRRQYSFYNAETCPRVGATLKAHLHEAWKASQGARTIPAGVREALEFYGDKANHIPSLEYCENVAVGYGDSEIYSDSGQRAREALALIDGTTKELCQHDWVDADNLPVNSMSICLKCHTTVPNANGDER